jgi:hypothetical protein
MDRHGSSRFEKHQPRLRVGQPRNWRSISDKGKSFSPFHRVQIDTGIHRISYRMSMGVMRPGREADHSLLSCAEVLNVWSYTSTGLGSPGYIPQSVVQQKRKSEELTLTGRFNISMLARHYPAWLHCDRTNLIHGSPKEGLSFPLLASEDTAAGSSAVAENGHHLS